jgi:alkylation response protein AidB-like acyl-CoA dehydrogenase
VADHDFRAEVRDWLAAHQPQEPLPSGDTFGGFAVNRAWEQALFRAGFAAVAWPAEYGGRGRPLRDWLVFEEEYFRAGLPQRVCINGIALLAPALMDFGTPRQKSRYLRRIAAAEDVWCQGWSEPEAGSDLASLRSRAVRDDTVGGWRLFGQKCWSTRGAFSTHMFGLFRTGTQAERHRGLTYFLIDLDQPQVDVRPVGRLDGAPGFADVYFDGAWVPDNDVLGSVGGGWEVAMATAGAERSLMLRAPGRFTAAAERLLDLYRGSDPAHPDRMTRRRAVADAWMSAQAYRLATDVALARIERGESIGPEASGSKIFWSELDLQIQAAGLAFLDEPDREGSRWLHDYQFALAGPIYAGTNEIQRNIVAERVLGLPR